MENGRILVGSISNAIKAKRILEKEGIYATLVKESDRTTGCSYGLSFDARHAYRVYAVLSKAGIHLRAREEKQ